MSIRAQTAPTVVHLTRNLSPPIGAQRLRGPGAVLRELVGNSVPLPGNPSERDPPRIPGHLRFGLQFGERGAYWAMLGPDVDLRRTDYDYGDAVTRILAKASPVADKFAERVLAPPPATTAVERWG